MRVSSIAAICAALMLGAVPVAAENASAGGGELLLPRLEGTGAGEVGGKKRLARAEGGALCGKAKRASLEVGTGCRTGELGGKKTRRGKKKKVEGGQGY
jgi:hypothetical protein